MSWKIEYGEKRFAVIAPDGNDDADAATYCDMVTVEFEGRVFAAYLNGDEQEIDPGPDEANYLDPAEPRAHVYDITDWPKTVRVETTTEEVEFAEDVEPEPGAAAV